MQLKALENEEGYKIHRNSLKIKLIINPFSGVAFAGVEGNKLGTSFFVSHSAFSLCTISRKYVHSL